jgi:trk system potassium uptake protein TrkA
MQVIIAGCGRVGSQLALLLSQEGHNVVVIDRDPNAFKRLEMSFNGVTLTGMAFDEALLREAGIEGAGAFAAITNYDNTNLMAAEIASGIFGVPLVTARVYNPDKEMTYRTMGIDYICGSTVLAEIFHRAVIAGGSMVHADWGGGLQVLEVEIGPDREGLAIKDLRSPGSGRLLALMRGERPVFFSRDTQLTQGDRLVLAAETSDRAFMDKIMPVGLRRSLPGRDAGKDAMPESRRSRQGWRVIVAGCGRVGAQLSEMLSLDGFQVTVIDRDRGAFDRLSKSFQGDALAGVAFDLDTLEEAGIGDADVFAATTNYDNTNLMAAEVARSIYGTRNVFARLYNPDKEQTFQALDIDYICGTTILAEQFMQRIASDRMKILAWTANNRVLLVEFTCPARFAAKPVGKLEREELLRVGLVSHQGRTEVATKATTMYRGDKIVAAVLAGRLHRVRRMMETGWTLGMKARRAGSAAY